MLLFNLESQVKFEALPWVRAVDVLRDSNQNTHALAINTLTRVASTVIKAFPYQIIPNKLLREIRTLADSADLDIPIVDELAADDLLPFLAVS